MGWNSQAFYPITYQINWKDEVGDRRMDEFGTDLREEVEAFIAKRIKETFETEIQNDRVTFMCGNYDSYSK